MQPLQLKSKGLVSSNDVIASAEKITNPQETPRIQSEMLNPKPLKTTTTNESCIDHPNKKVTNATSLSSEGSEYSLGSEEDRHSEKRPISLEKKKPDDFWPERITGPFITAY